MTKAQERAYKWLAERGGTGVFMQNGVLLAAGECAPVMRATWNALRNDHYVTIDGKRVTVLVAPKRRG